MTQRLVLFLLLMLCSASSLADVSLVEKLPKGILMATGMSAPPLALTTVDGNKFDLAEQRGRWVFVHFWASWCGPCRREIPAIQRLMESNKKLVFAIVNTAEDEETIFNFIGVIAPDVDSLMDRDGLATEAWKPRGLPSTYLVDPDGVIRYQALGGRSWEREDYMKFLRSLGAEN